jgi:hypothetical protein
MFASAPSHFLCLCCDGIFKWGKKTCSVARTHAQQHAAGLNPTFRCKPNLDKSYDEGSRLKCSLRPTYILLTT